MNARHKILRLDPFPEWGGFWVAMYLITSTNMFFFCQLKFARGVFAPWMNARMLSDSEGLDSNGGNNIMTLQFLMLLNSVLQVTQSMSLEMHLAVMFVKVHSLTPLT